MTPTPEAIAATLAPGPFVAAILAVRRYREALDAARESLGKIDGESWRDKPPRL